MFTCLSTRAVHLEALESLDTSPFLNAFTRFCAIRGFPQSLRSDRGTNFIGASKKVKGIDPDIVSQKLRVRNVEWKFNPPHSSHFGGVWERKIGASRRVLEGILTTLQRKTLDRESFVTFLAEVSRVVNDTPLWVTSWDSNDPAPLCPNDILMLRDASGAEDYESYTERDLLAHGLRRYRRAKYLTQLFWQRWERDFLVTLNKRSKWFVKNKGVSVGDVVLIVEDSVPRSEWPYAIISELIQSGDGLVRSVVLRSKGKTLTRPLCKIVIILPVSYKNDIDQNSAVAIEM